MAILSFLVFLLILGILIFVHELGHFLVAKWTGMQVDEFSIGFPPRIWKKKKRGTLYTVGAVPFGGYVKIRGENPEEAEGDDHPGSFDARPVWARMLVIVAGVAMNVLFAFVALTVAFSIGFSSLYQDLTTVPGASVRSSQVLVVDTPAGSPAEKAGIEPGDILVSIQDSAVDPAQALSTVGDLQTYTNARQKEGKTSVIIHLDRNGQPFTVTSSLNASGYPLEVVVQSLQRVRVPLWRAPVVAIKEMGYIIRLTWDALAGFAHSLFRAKLDPNVSGPVGIYQATAAATRVGFDQVLLLTVVLSLNLALLNIIPIPALDGGRLLFLITEAVFRKRVVRRHVEAWVTQISFIFLMLLIVVLTARDVIRLF